MTEGEPDELRDLRFVLSRSHSPSDPSDMMVITGQERISANRNAICADSFAGAARSHCATLKPHKDRRRHSAAGVETHSQDRRVRLDRPRSMLGKLFHVKPMPTFRSAARQTIAGKLARALVPCLAAPPKSLATGLRPSCDRPCNSDLLAWNAAMDASDSTEITRKALYIRRCKVPQGYIAPSPGKVNCGEHAGAQLGNFALQIKSNQLL